MSFTFKPEFYFRNFEVATADFLISNGIKGIILDVDNTLEPYENSLPGDHVVRWLEELHRNGISASIVSNNNGDRINLFNKDLCLPVFYKAKKPFKKNLLRAMKAMGTDVGNTILMGDQIFTDVWAAHNSGIPAILVPPINDKKDLLTKFKRWLEKPILKGREPQNKATI